MTEPEQCCNSNPDIDPDELEDDDDVCEEVEMEDE